MIIVEGPDGGGKTRLARDLAEHWRLPIAPRVVGKDTQAIESVSDWVEQNVQAGWQPKIFDRHRLISEPIYGPILRGNNQDPKFLDRFWVWEWMSKFVAIQPFVIYCLPPLEVVVDNCVNDENNDNTAVVDHIVAIYSAYVARAALHMSTHPGTTDIWDYTRDGLENNPLATFNSWGRIVESRRSW